MAEQCIGGMYGPCSENADFIRHTQFAGSHPLCKKHAEEDKDFMKTSSYLFWEVLSDADC